MYLSTKTYNNDRGLSCVFRQKNATSHCHDWHGYALGFRFTFAASHLDERNWVVDFGPGGCGEIKNWLEHMFDHTFLVAEDDPTKDEVLALTHANVRIIPAAGCEAVAKLAYDFAQKHIQEVTNGRCWVESVECFEHGANSAIYRNPDAYRLAEQVRVADLWKETAKRASEQLASPSMNGEGTSASN